MNKTKSIIWAIASVTAGTALYVLLPSHWLHWWHMFQFWIQGDSPSTGFPFWVLPGEIMFDLILILKLIASYGMFRLRGWGRTLAIYALSADFLFRLAGFINVVTYQWRHPEIIQRYSEMESIPGHVVITWSLIPSYIIGLLSLISVVMLFTRPLKETFRSFAMEAKLSESRA